MKRKLLLLLGAVLFPGMLWAGATFTRVKNWSEGQTLTASDLNAEFNNILNNLDPAGVDDYSATVTQMRATTDPYPGGVEVQATSLAGEIERLRYQVLQLKLAIQASSATYWYQDTPTAGVFTIDSNGYVGINQTAPIYPLHVKGVGTSGIMLENALSSNKQWALLGSGNNLIVNEYGVQTPMTFLAGGGVTASSVTVSTLAVTNTATVGNLTVTGMLTASSLSKVAATKTGSTALSSGSNQLSWQTETFDTNSEFNGTTFTANTAGYYMVTFQATLQGDGTADDPIQFTVNRGTGTSDIVAHVAGTMGTAFDYYPFYTSNIVLLSAGQTLSFWATSSAAGTTDLYGPLTFMTIYKLQ